MPDALERFADLPTVGQVVVLSVVLDPAFALAGYGLAPALGVDPGRGALFGVVVAAVPIALLVASWGTRDAEVADG